MLWGDREDTKPTIINNFPATTPAPTQNALQPAQPPDVNVTVQLPPQGQPPATVTQTVVQPVTVQQPTVTVVQPAPPTVTVVQPTVTVTQPTVTVVRPQPTVIVAGPNVNRQPIVSAGRDLTIFEGESVQLEGSVSDPDGDIVRSFWTGPVDLFSDMNNPQSFFTGQGLDSDYMWTLTLTAIDARGARHSDTMNVLVKNRVPIFTRPTVTPPTVVTQ